MQFRLIASVSLLGLSLPLAACGSGGATRDNSGALIPGPIAENPSSATPPGTPGGAGGAGTTDMGVEAIVPGTPLPTDETGFVFLDLNEDDVPEVQGPWYGYNDCGSSPNDCTTVEFPPMGEFPNTDGVMCTSGVTAQVSPAGEFSAKFGAGIGLDLNNMGGVDPDTGIAPPKGTFDAMAAGITGVAFRLDSVPMLNGVPSPDGLRVALQTPFTLNEAHFIPLRAGGVYEVRWGEVAQGSWVLTPVGALDATQLVAIQFQIPSTQAGAVSFDFCVSELSLLTD